MQNLCMAIACNNFGFHQQHIMRHRSRSMRNKKRKTHHSTSARRSTPTTAQLHKQRKRMITAESKVRVTLDCDTMASWLRSNAGRGMLLREELLHKKFAGATAKEYASIVDRIARCVRMSRGMQVQPSGYFDDIIFTQSDFWNYLVEARRQGQAHSTIRGIASAVIHYQFSSRFGLAPGEAPWAHEPQIAAALSGMQFDGKDLSRPERGAITLPMLQQLIDWCYINDYYDYAIPLALQWHLGCRIGQLMKVRAGELIPDEQGTMLGLHQRKNATISDPDNIFYRSMSADAEDLYLFASEGVHRGELLFPKSKIRVDRLREAVTLAAADLLWPSDGIFYDGTQTCRHGNVAKVVEEATEAVRELFLKATTGMKSSKTIKHYARPLAERGFHGTGRRRS